MFLKVVFRMANEVVKYNNEMNKIAFTGFSPSELNVFYSLCALMKEKNTSEITLSYQKLIEVSGLKDSYLSEQKQTKIFEDMYKNLLKLTFGFDDGDNIIYFNLFNRFHLKRSKKEISIKVNEDYSYILNNLANNFTRFELLEFNQISGEYPKLLYRHLKQWKTTGEWEVSIDEFKRLMDIPTTYRMTNIDKRVLEPSIEELKKIKDFENLRVTKKKKGRRVDKLIFNFNEWVHEIIIKDKPKHKTKKKYIDQRVIIKATDYNEDIIEKTPTEKFIDVFKILKIMSYNIGKGTEKESLSETEFNNLVDESLVKLNLQANEVTQQIEQLREDYVLKTEVHEEQLTFDIE